MRPSVRNALAVVLLVVSGAVIPGRAANAQQASAQQLEDVVYLKDGSIIRGTIVEQRPGESILIRTRDGNQFRYRMDQIDRLAKEAPAHAAAAVQNPKSVGAAVALSVLLTGAGQGYNGQWGKAGGFFIGAILSYGAMSSALNTDECVFNDECGSAGGWALVFVANYIWCVVDAGVSASKINSQALRSATLFVKPTTNVVLDAKQGRQGSSMQPVAITPALQVGLRLRW